MELDSKHMKKAIFLIGFAVLFMWLLDNIVMVISIVKGLFSIISPFILGLVLAFLLNGPMRFLENKMPWGKGIFRKVNPGIKRGISFLITLTLFIAILSLISFIIIPGLINTLQDLISESSSYIEKVQVFVTNFIENNDLLQSLESMKIMTN